MLRLVPYGFLLFFTCASSTFPAAACDVGTPNNEGSWLITSTDIGVIWTQTDTNQFDYWFDIDASPWEQSVGNYGPIVAPQGIRVFYQFNNVRGGPGSQHCFRMWTRQSPNGCRSDLPSAWTCVTLPTPPPAVRIVIHGWMPPFCLGIQGYNPHNGDNLEMVRCAGGMRLIKYGRSKMA